MQVKRVEMLKGNRVHGAGIEFDQEYLPIIL
jgi:hypothetical protein